MPSEIPSNIRETYEYRTLDLETNEPKRFPLDGGFRALWLATERLIVITSSFMRYRLTRGKFLRSQTIPYV